MPKQLSILEQESLALVEQMQSDYLEQRDLAAVLAGMERNVSWIGSGLGERCSSLEEAQVELARDFQEYPGHFTISSYHYLTRILAEDVCLVYGELLACPEDPAIADQRDRLSAVCIKTPEGMKLAHLHISNPNINQEVGRFYVRREAEQEREAYQAQAAAVTQRLEARDRELAILTENIPGGIYQCQNDQGFSLISVNSGFLSMVGYTREELRDLLQDRFIALVHPEDRTMMRQTAQKQLAENEMIELEYRLRRKDGQIIWVLDKGRQIVTADGVNTMYCILLDNTAQHRTLEELRLSLEKHKIIMDQATDIIFEWDIYKDTLLFSPNWRKKFGYDPISQEISQRIPCSENIHPDDIPVFIKLMQDTARGAPYSEAEFRIRSVLGNYTWCRIRATAQYDGAGKAIKAVGVILDIDRDKRLRQKLMDQAQRDSLTGLLNKDSARQAVEQSLYAQREAPGVLMIIDLDDFKTINDHYGHLAGDKVLTATSTTLKSLFRANDVLARIGGDEFLIYLPGAPADEAERKAQSVIQALKEIPIFDRTGLVSCSVGAAVRCGDVTSFVELYRCADTALYQVKNAGKGGFALYSSALCAQALDSDVVRSAVNAAIDSDNISATLGEYCFRLLYRAIDPITAVDQILELIGRAYDVSRVYIFESSEDGLRCSNTFEWCNEGISSEKDRLQDLAYADLNDYPSHFDEQGVFYCGDIREVHPDVYAILAPQNICAILQCAIMDDGQFKGYVGFDECRENRHWTREQVDALTLVSNVLSTFLVKLRLKEQLSRLTGQGDARS